MQNQFGSNVVSQYDYVYDALRRRTSLITSGPAIDTLPQPTVPEQDITYTTNTVNQYTHVDTDGTDVSLDYDLDGSLKTDGRFMYEYNAENRMIAATPLDTASGLQKVEADYDYLGRRVSKTVYSYIAGAWTLDTTTTFVYDGWNVIQERITEGGSPSTVQYVWGLDLSGTLQGAGGIGGLLLRKTDSGTFAYAYDANGNVEQLINVTDGSIAARYKYDPFGVVLVADGPEAQANPYRYSTQYFDIETELTAYIFRYYSARLGRWTTRDPLEEQGGLNLYVLLNNSSVNYIDPLGLMNLAACVELLASIYEQAGKLLKELQKYDPVADAKGGFIHAHGVTRPGGHYEEIKGLQKGLKNRLAKFTKSCLKDDDDDDDDSGEGGYRYPKWADQLANVWVPEPVYNPVPVQNIPMVLPEMPELETAIVEFKAQYHSNDIEITAQNVAVAGGAVVGCYIIYRGVRMLPSFVPVLWWTIPINTAIP